VRLFVVPISWRAACDFIADLHRHHRPPRGQKWAIGCIDESGKMRGVATCGRPVARAYDDGITLEVNRTCTDGCPNANSFLYGACARIAANMGYSKIVTYTQEGESGISLRAAGWKESKRLPSRGGWAESSVKLKHIRDPIGAGGIARILWVKETA
jgi:hypothetical protein